MFHTISRKLLHFYHVVSNVRPTVWISLYVALMPLFALFYYLLPAGQFRIPDGGGTDYGSWLYYSIVTLTTLGFGDYTPAMGWAQCITAVEVLCGLVVLGLFLNAVGSMKSEIDVGSELEKQREIHKRMESEKLHKSAPGVIAVLENFISHASELQSDATEVKKNGFLRSAARAALCLDALQSRVDLTLWPELLENCFTFVAEYQLYISSEDKNPEDGKAFQSYIAASAKLAENVLNLLSGPEGENN